MPELNDSDKTKRINVVLDRLVKIRWIKGVNVNDLSGVHKVEWTEKGRERARQVIDIVTELHGGTDDLWALSAICLSHRP